MTIQNTRNYLTFYVAIYLTLTTLTTSQQEYAGPAKIEYFEQSFNQSIDDLPELKCPDTELITYKFKETTAQNLTDYYKLTITSEMKEKYSSALYLSTCCDLLRCETTLNTEKDQQSCTKDDIASYYTSYVNESYNPVIKQNYNIDRQYCPETNSLDTVMYIFQQKKDRINHFEFSDDSECGNKAKSTIDLSEYLEGDYIVGIGGYGQEYGKYFLQLTCVQYSYPVLEEELNPPTNISSITCGKSVKDSLNQTINPADYYLLNITESTYLPASITISGPAMGLYLFIEGSDGNYEIVETILPGKSLFGSFSTYSAELKLIDYDSGIYWIFVQMVDGGNAAYELEMECTPYLPRDLMMLTIFGIAGVLLFLIFIYYVYELIKYNKNKHVQKGQDNVEVQLAEAKQMKGIQEVNEERKEEVNDTRDTLAGDKSVDGVLVAESIKSVIDPPMEENQDDVIQMVLAHAISCCEEEEEFDIFQVLAIRTYATHSRDVIAFSKPFARFGYDFELIKLSPFVICVFQTIVIAITQSWGIGFVIYKLIPSADIFECSMEQPRWNEVYPLKILSFLLSLVVTFFISQLLDGIKHNGLYEIMAKLKLKDIKRVNYIALSIVQIGQAINYCVCLMAILGSYFIIFSSNQGEEQDDGSLDYSTAGLDMILNAVALFFMLELDNLLVSSEDYQDCEHHLKWILENYKPPNLDKISDDKNNRIVTRLYYLIQFIATFVIILCYGGGFIAPFLIFFCW